VAKKTVGDICLKQFPAGGNTRTVTSLRLDGANGGIWDTNGGINDGGQAPVAGKVRNGFIPLLRREVYQRLKHLETDICPFDNLPERKSTPGTITQPLKLAGPTETGPDRITSTKAVLPQVLWQIW
jgi:hypothetical protein